MTHAVLGLKQFKPGHEQCTDIYLHSTRVCVVSTQLNV